VQNLPPLDLGLAPSAFLSLVLLGGAGAVWSPCRTPRTRLFEAGVIEPCKVGRCHRRAKRHCMSRLPGEILRGSAHKQPVKLLAARGDQQDEWQRRWSERENVDDLVGRRVDDDDPFVSKNDIFVITVLRNDLDHARWELVKPNGSWNRGSNGNAECRADGFDLVFDDYISDFGALLGRDIDVRLRTGLLLFCRRRWRPRDIAVRRTSSACRFSLGFGRTRHPGLVRLPALPNGIRRANRNAALCLTPGLPAMRRNSRYSALSTCQNEKGPEGSERDHDRRSLWSPDYRCQSPRVAFRPLYRFSCYLPLIRPFACATVQTLASSLVCLTRRHAC
jgi:hypothetical protein